MTFVMIWVKINVNVIDKWSIVLISYGEMTKWGQTIRFLINTKQKLVLGTKKSKNGKVVE